jgi:uncharacterized protein YjbI with pentapeptide repeats
VTGWWEVPDREAVRAVLIENFVGPITDEIVERLTEHVRAVMADRAALGWEVLAFHPSNGRRGFGYRWREVLSFEQSSPRPIDLVAWIAYRHPGYPPALPHCPSELVGTWLQTAPCPATWELDADGTLRTTAPGFTHRIRWAVLRMSPPMRDSLWVFEEASEAPKTLHLEDAPPDRLVFTIWGSEEPYRLERPDAVPLPPVIVVEEPEPPPQVVSEFTTAALTDHREWIARGRRGPGRLVIEDASVGPLGLGVAKLGGARLLRVKFFNHKVDFANLSGAELVECIGQGTDFTDAILDGATLDRCTFEKSHFGLTDFHDGRILGGSFRGSTADRGLWNRVRIKDADLRSFRFGDCVLDGAVLEDCDLRDADLHCITPVLESLCSTLNATFLRCDLRGANIDQRRFDNTRFVDCKLHGLIGASRLEGPNPYTLENCDFSAAGDGSDLRTSLTP